MGENREKIIYVKIQLEIHSYAFTHLMANLNSVEKGMYYTVIK